MHRNPAQDPIELTDEQVRAMALKTLQTVFDLQVEGSTYTTEQVWDVVLVASAQGCALESAADPMETAPPGNTVRKYLRERLLAPRTLLALEEECNQLLRAQWPPGVRGGCHKVAIDLVFIPYHGHCRKEAREIRRAQAKSGTTHFHCYATAYVTTPTKRVTLALTFVQADDTLVQVLQRLLDRLQALSVEIRRLLLDRGFFSVPVIRSFQQHHPHLEVILPVVVRGKQGGTRALLRGRRSYRTTYTMSSPQHGEVTFDVAVACTYQKGRAGRQGIKHFGYAVLGPVRSDPRAIHAQYDARFGIESSYRLMNRTRARTSSRCPKLRLLFVGLAFALVNLWVYLKWTFAARPCRGGRQVEEALFRLDRFCLFLLQAIYARYGVVRSITRPAPRPAGDRS